MKYLKYTLCTVLVLLVSVACDVNSEKFPTDLEELRQQENTGGFLRIKTVNSAGFDQVDLQNAAYEIILEADDAQDGGQLESVEFYIAFEDNSGDGDGVEELSSPFRTLEASDFSPAEDTGLPVYTFTLTGPEAASAVGVPLSEWDTFDVVQLRWVLHLTNGKSFTSDNTGSNVSGGAFYNSPFQSGAPIAPLVDPETFVGTYEVTQQATSASISGAFGNGYLFDDDDDEDAVEDQTFTVEITTDPDNTLFGRVMTGFTYQAQIVPGLDGATSFSFELIRGPSTPDNRVNFPEQNTGITCGGPGIQLGPSSNDGSFDTSDDSGFTMYLIENPNTGCGVPPSAPLEFTFVKQ